MEEENIEELEDKQIKETHYTVSQHAAERFCEREWGYKTQTDKTKYANLRSTEIRNFLNKLCTYGECIFKGKIRQYNETMVYKKDQWVVLVDPRNNKIITCYPIAFGVGEDYDIEYVNRMSVQLEDAVKNKQEIEVEITECKNNFEEKIKEIDSKINDYKSLINQLQEQKSGYEQIIKNSDSELKEAQIKIESIIESMTHKKIM